jgi:hypothetical protein
VRQIKTLSVEYLHREAFIADPGLPIREQHASIIRVP